ncbi:ADP-ribosyl cyclase/cyclic ADP-ribose hydrolase 1-like isoform X2 [Cheilinus undulatus]|uniref:ADP-ribosyl cyclase/cyclic ADP-ribose hydrolase 1-like isoform X2 n=1 Tax=Cheilinus undulatus TaxID=241271 RepID=UPI001BD68712|nr:ADP-ribosyl cyclase/cyclic ADP-ribose hydrolase 1-like isoform X2 [Cheilinus undulatus]
MVSKKAIIIGGVAGVPLLLLVCLLCFAFIPQTGQFRATFLGRCRELGGTSQDCENILSVFQQTYEGKKRIDFSEENYQPFFDRFPFTHPCYRTMLWSGTEDLVTKFTEKTNSFYTLDKTSVRKLMKTLKWCGMEGHKGTYTYFCEIANQNPMKAYWTAASARFAKYACDKVTVMLDGERKEPYHPNSMFRKVELPSLRSPPDVWQLKVVLVTQTNRSFISFAQESVRQGITQHFKK